MKYEIINHVSSLSLRHTISDSNHL